MGHLLARRDTAGRAGAGGVGDFFDHLALERILWPLIVLNRSEVYTLQVGLNAFQGELDVQWHYMLAMTVLSLIPVVLIFAFLQNSSPPESPAPE